MLTLLTVTLSPTISPGGFAALVIVTVVPLSAADVIILTVPGQIAGSPPAHIVPAAHPGMDAIAVKESVTGLYSSAVLSAVWLGGGIVGTPTDRNDCPVEPPTISTCPSSAVPLPSIRVAVGPLRAIVIKPSLPPPAYVNDLVLSLYSSAVWSALHMFPLTASNVAAVQVSPPAISVSPLGSTTAAADS